MADSEYELNIHQFSQAIFKKFPGWEAELARSIAESNDLNEFYIPPDPRSFPEADAYARQISFATRDKKASLENKLAHDKSTALVVKKDADMIAYIRPYQSHDKVDKNQFQSIGVLQHAGLVGNEQFQVCGVALQYAKKVGKEQGQSIGASIQYAGEVGELQAQGLGVVLQYARQIDGNQFQVCGAGVRYAKQIKGNQITYVGPSINIAEKIGGRQIGLVNVVTGECNKFQAGLINYSNDEWHSQYGLINLRKGKRWAWNVEINLLFSRGKRKKLKKLRGK